MRIPIPLPPTTLGLTEIGHLTPLQLSVYQFIYCWHLFNPTMDPMECYSSDIATLVFLIHISCHISPHTPLILDQTQNPISSGLWHTIRHTLNTPTLGSTSGGWFHFAAGPLTRSLTLLLVLALLPLRVQPTSYNSEGFLFKTGKKAVLRAGFCHGFLIYKSICETAELWKDKSYSSEVKLELKRQRSWLYA